MSAGRIAMVAAALLALQVIGFHDLRHDDAFITFRYGQNIVRGRGVTFNPGQRRMVSTAPAHVAVSATVYAVAGQEHTPSVMSALGCAGWIAQAWAVLLLARRAFPNLGAVFMALGVALGAAWSQRFVALETNLAAAGVLWALVASAHRRHSTAMVLASLAGLLRPDAYLVLLPVAVVCVRELGWRAWKPATWGAAVSAPWVLFAALYFGTLLPASFAAKVQTVAPGVYAEAAAHYAAASLVLGRPELHVPRFVAPGVTGLSLWVLTLGVWGAAAAGAALWIRRHRSAWVLPATGLLYLGAYLLLRPRIGMEWHLYPVMLVLATGLLALVVEATLWLRRWPGGRAVGVALMVLLLAGLAWRTARSARDHRRAFWYGARHDVYRCIARELKRRAGPGDVVLVGEIGTLAYYTDLRLVDTGGLIPPDPRSGHHRRARWAVSIEAYPLSTCPRPHLLRAVSGPVATSELHPRGHKYFAAVLCALGRPASGDRTPPRVTGFRVEVATATRRVTVHWRATDEGGLWRVELWRAPDHRGKPDPKGWQPVAGATRPLTGTRAGGRLADTLPPGRWWYGVHVLDHARNIGYEPAPRGVDLSRGSGDRPRTSPGR